MKPELLIRSIWSRLERAPKNPQDVIFDTYHQLRRTPAGSKHERRYLALQGLVREEQDALHDLVFSGRLNESELEELIHFGGHGGSVAKENNTHWAPFVARVRTRQNELPTGVQSGLNWLNQVHGW